MNKKEAHQEWLKRWKARGGKTRKYQCPSCLKEVERHVPNQPGEIWDSAMECPECEGLHFVVVPYRGKIKVEKMQDPPTKLKRKRA